MAGNGARLPPQETPQVWRHTPQFVRRKAQREAPCPLISGRQWGRHESAPPGITLKDEERRKKEGKRVGRPTRKSSCAQPGRASRRQGDLRNGVGANRDLEGPALDVDSRVGVDLDDVEGVDIAFARGVTVGHVR